MNWGLMAGGVSKGLEQALEGANKGLVQGEGIRAGRAQEGLQQQQLGLSQEHLGLSRQQLQNTMAQQDFMNRLARERFGFDREQFGAQQRHQGWQERHGDELRGIQRDEYGLKREAFPYDRALTEAKTDYYRNPNLRMAGRGGFEQQFKNAEAQRRGYESYFDIADPAVRGEIDQMFTKGRPNYEFNKGNLDLRRSRVELLNRHLQEALANPPLSGAERARQSMAIEQARVLQGALNRASQADIMGTQIRPQDQAILDSLDFDQIIASLRGVQHSAAGRGFNAANPGETPVSPVVPQGPQGSALDQVLGKWGLQRPGALQPPQVPAKR